jgi:ligand-binding SRPBCC domain-containing protein
VWRFHEPADVLTLPIPPWQPVQIVHREGGLASDAASEFRSRLKGFPVSWIFPRIEREPSSSVSKTARFIPGSIATNSFQNPKKHA